MEGRDRHDLSLLATVDEAMHGKWYVLAAAIMSETDVGRIRDGLRMLLLRRQKRLHWREESSGRREKLVSAALAARCLFVVVVGVGMDERRQERARRQCLERLLWELDQRRVQRVIAETRHAERNATDIRAIGAFRRSGVVSPMLGFEHGQPVQEPLLWLPDIVAGAVLAGYTGRSYLRLALDDILIEIQIELR
jgi:hypothetical protein